MGHDFAVMTIQRPTPKADAAAVAAVDAARAALLDEVDAADVGEHLGHEVEGERVVTHLFACARARLPRLALVGHRRPRVAAEARHRRRGRADPRRRGDRRARVGALPRADPARRPVARATCCPWRTTTRGWSRRTPSATTRSTPTTRPRSAPSPRTSASAGSARSRPRAATSPPSAGTTATAGPSAPLAQSAPELLHDLRLPGPHRRPARGAVRRLRQRRRQRRRPGRVASTTAAAPTPRCGSPRSTSRCPCRTRCVDTLTPRARSRPSSRSRPLGSGGPRQHPHGVLLRGWVQLVGPRPQVDAQPGAARRRRRTPRAGSRGWSSGRRPG